METSKRLLWIFVSFFILSVLLTGIVNIILKIDLSYLLNYVTPLCTSVILGYIGKASVENYTKIKNNPTPQAVITEPEQPNNFSR